MSFDELRAVVAYGDGEGVVARFPGLLAVAAGPDDAVERLLTLCRESAGPAPGRGLARRLAAWLGDDDGEGPPDALRFGTVAATDRGVAVFLNGDVDLLVPEQGVAIAGADAASWTDRLIDTPDAPLALTLQGTAPLVDLVDGVFDLREGTVPGVAVAAVGALAPEEPDRDGAGHGEPQRGGSERGGTGRGGTDGGPAAAPPVPAGPALPDDATEVVARLARHRKPTGAQAVGARRPPTDPPDARRPDDERADAGSPDGGPPNAVPTGDVVRSGAVRPPAGTLVFDDGTRHAVEAGYLLGREPDGDARVRSGVLRPITLDDPTGAMSRVHAEIRLEDADVLLADSGSSNGTFVADPDAQSWTVLAPTHPYRLTAGVRVRLGSRTFTFEAPSGPR
jgi:hypothetical protein